MRRVLMKQHRLLVPSNQCRRCGTANLVLDGRDWQRDDITSAALGIDESNAVRHHSVITP